MNRYEIRESRRLKQFFRHKRTRRSDRRDTVDSRKLHMPFRARTTAGRWFLRLAGVGEIKLNGDLFRFEMDFPQIAMRSEVFALTSDYPFRHSLIEIRLLKARRGQCSTVPELRKATRLSASTPRCSAMPSCGTAPALRSIPRASRARSPAASNQNSYPT